MTYTVPLNKLHVITETVSTLFSKIKSGPVFLCDLASCHIYLFVLLIPETQNW